MVGETPNEGMVVLDIKDISSKHNKKYENNYSY